MFTTALMFVEVSFLSLSLDRLSFDMVMLSVNIYGKHSGFLFIRFGPVQSCRV